MMSHDFMTDPGDVSKLGRKCYCHTIEKNHKVWNQHTKFGFERYGDRIDDRIGEKMISQELTLEKYRKQSYQKINHTLNMFSHRLR